MKRMTDGYFDPIVPSEALVQRTLEKIKRQKRNKIVYLWQCAASAAACAALFLLTGSLSVEHIQGSGATASIFAIGPIRLLPPLLLVLLLGTFTALYFNKKKSLER